jgi:drug/metabolite transporter (DMT)-like permease
MLLAAAASAVMNGLIRSLADEVHPFQIGFFRCLFGLLVLLPLVLRAGVGSLRTERLGLHALRGGLNAVAMLAFFFAVAITPLATVAALAFTSPLFATLLAALILRERVGRARALGLLLGFFGALVVIRPAGGEVGLGAVLVVASSAVWAAALIDIKVLARTESSVAITVWGALFLTPVTLVAALPFWVGVDTATLAILALIGALGSLTQVSLTQALREADASHVLPADFTKLIWATLIGLVAFGEIPDAWTLAGAGMILLGVAQLTYGARRHGPKAGDAAGDGRAGGERLG